MSAGTPDTKSWLLSSLSVTVQIRNPVVKSEVGILRLSLMVISSVRGLDEVTVSLSPLTVTVAPPSAVTLYLESTLLVSVRVRVYFPFACVSS